MKAQERVYDIEELCSLTGLTVRTIRYYIQMGVVAPPEGQKRGAYYTRHHLEQLLAVRRWRNSGVSLERIKELLQPIPPEGLVPSLRRTPGEIEVWSRVFLDDGLELHIEPGRARLSPEQVRTLVRGAVKLVKEVRLAEQSPVLDWRMQKENQNDSGKSSTSS